jgi:hypothetical protein
MLLGLAGVLSERDRLINLYVREENRTLREQLGRWLRLTDHQRRRQPTPAQSANRWQISAGARPGVRPHEWVSSGYPVVIEWVSGRWGLKKRGSWQHEGPWTELS